MSDLARKIQEELKLAFAVRDEEALGRAARTIADAAFTADLRSDVRLIAERMEMGFAHVDQRIAQIDKRFEEILHYMDKRFEQVDKRFEQIDKRFEQVDKRFEQVDKRFEQIDKRFEDTLHTMDKRFETVRQSTDTRFAELHAGLVNQFNTMRWVGSLGFTLLAVLISIYQFIA